MDGAPAAKLAEGAETSAIERRAGPRTPIEKHARHTESEAGSCVHHHYSTDFELRMQSIKLLAALFLSWRR